MHFFEKSARALAILEPHLDPESAKNRIFFGFARCRTSKIRSRIDTHLIFFPVKAEMSYLQTVIFRGPDRGPTLLYFDLN